jgi:hypothetical protein
MGIEPIISPAEQSLPCGVFKRIQVVLQPLGGTIIAWELSDGFGAYGPFNFYIDFGRSGTNVWECLNPNSPVVDDCIFIDPCQRYWDALPDFYYRIRLSLPSQLDPSTQLCTVYQSQPQQANGYWNKRDWLLAREICRKEFLLQRKRTNMTSEGFILKRRRFGAKCAQCREADTGEVLNSNCPNCYGTGFVGGYFPARKFTVTTNAPWERQFKVDGQVSLRNDVVRQGRAVSYPYPDTRDVFVRKDNGERSVLELIKTIAEVGGIPVVIYVELRLAPVTDIIYTVPLAGTPSSSSSSSSSSAVPPVCDYRVGQNSEPEW